MLLVFRERQSHRDRGADAFLTVDGDEATVSLHNVANPRQANASAWRRISGIASAIARFKHVGNVDRWDADPPVDDGKDGPWPRSGQRC